MPDRSTLPRRTLLGAALAAVPLRRAGAQDAPIRVRDLLDREVVLPRPARRVVLGAGRHLAVLNLLAPDPGALVVGWNDDLRTGQAGEYDAFRRRFPGLDAVPVLGHGTQPMNPEAVLALRPELVLLTRTAALDGRLTAPTPGAAPPPGLLLRTLEAAGVPVAVVDFFQDPLADTRPSMELLGRVLGREEQAAQFLAFYQTRLDRVRALHLGEARRPSVFMHAHAGGLDCCFSPGRGTFDEFVRLAGGRNIGADKLPGVVGQLSLEYVLSTNADVYVATGGPYGGRGGVSLGAGVTPAEAGASLRAMIDRQHLGGLAAMRTGQAHALWHGFNDSPAHILAVEVMARWLHPEATAAVDPDATLRQLNERFAAVPMDGTYWTSLAPA